MITSRCAAIRLACLRYKRRPIPTPPLPRCSNCDDWAKRRAVFGLRSFSTSISAHRSVGVEEEVEEEAPQPLVVLKDACMGYRGTSPTTIGPLDLMIRNPKHGGHVVLGENGTGKTLLSNVFASNGSKDAHLVDGSYQAHDPAWHPNYSIAHVSFESHQQVLQAGGTAYSAITGGVGNLNKAAQFLVVRFGLYPLLHRDVDTLSTGEIRKVLLVRALSRRPKLLVLDNAFDGLDVPSRDALADLVSKTLRGFRQDILVQSIDSRNTAHTQVLLITHRGEEIVDEIKRVSYWSEGKTFVTENRNDLPGADLLSKVLGADAMTVEGCWDDSTLPIQEDLSKWWKEDRIDQDETLTTTTSLPPVIRATNLSVKKGDYTLLHNLNWTVDAGSRWLVAGGNGAGKSTLSRLLARPDEDDGVPPDQLTVENGGRGRGIGWVSTELHMASSQSKDTVRQVVTCGGNTADDTVSFVVQALLMNDISLDRAFSDLSQGQQKLVLIAAALASRPQLLVLDEPCQGLDGRNRRRVLGLVERICQATNMSLVYITHHLEELLPSVTHVLHLKGGKGVYNGARASYNPVAAAK